MADNTGTTGKLPDKSTNQHVSNAARLAEASKGSADASAKAADAAKEETSAAQKVSDAAQKAAPTGKDIPALAAENIKGHQTAISRPDQPKTKDDLKATGAQLEPALIAKDGGSIPHGMIPSPTGPIPASAVGDPAAQLARHSETLKAEHSQDGLSEELLLSMNKHEIRAAAHDRGYKIGEGSVRSLTTRFLAAQGEKK